MLLPSLRLLSVSVVRILGYGVNTPLFGLCSKPNVRRMEPPTDEISDAADANLAFAPRPDIRSAGFISCGAPV
jgi:hypothetical protein